MSAVEVGRPPVAPPSAAPLAAMAPERERSALALYVVAGLVGIGLAIAAVMVSQASGSRVSATARALRIALSAPPTVPAAAPPSPRTEPTVDPVPQTSVASPGPVAAPARPLAPAVRSSASPRPCDPPYTINERGLKIVKVECIQ